MLRRILKRIFGKKRIKFGDNVSVMQNCLIDDQTTIGDYTYIGQNTAITKSTIGRFCSIGSDVIIGPGEHNLDSISTSAFFIDGDIYASLTEKESVIGNDVWIGAKAIILRGVHLGDGCVVGAGAVVTRDVDPFAIVVGVPAKVIRYRFNGAQQKKINDSHWWNFDLESARQIQEGLRSNIKNE